jgi:hypothetical protein
MAWCALLSAGQKSAGYLIHLSQPGAALKLQRLFTGQFTAESAGATVESDRQDI